MVFSKIKEALNPQDDKYEMLYYKYSKIKLENQEIKKKHLQEMKEYREKIQKQVADKLITLYENVEAAKSSSFKVHAVDKDLQRLLLDVNRTEKTMKEMMKDFNLEEVTPQERHYDPEIHEIASYEDAKGMAKGIILKTVKKGFRYRGDIIKKPKVIVTK